MDRTGKVILALIAASLLSGCVFQRAQIAADARTSMVGMTKEQTLACMGPPASQAAVGQTEVWSFDSTDGKMLYGDGIATRKFCKINMTMLNGRLAKVDYLGPSGGLLSAGEQCAYALQNCVAHP